VPEEALRWLPSSAYSTGDSQQDVAEVVYSSTLLASLLRKLTLTPKVLNLALVHQLVAFGSVAALATATARVCTFFLSSLPLSSPTTPTPSLPAGFQKVGVGIDGSGAQLSSSLSLPVVEGYCQQALLELAASLGIPELSFGSSATGTSVAAAVPVPQRTSSSLPMFEGADGGALKFALKEAVLSVATSLGGAPPGAASPSTPLPSAGVEVTTEPISSATPMDVSHVNVYDCVRTTAAFWSKLTQRDLFLKSPVFRDWSTSKRQHLLQAVQDSFVFGMMPVLLHTRFAELPSSLQLALMSVIVDMRERRQELKAVSACRLFRFRLPAFVGMEVLLRRTSTPAGVALASHAVRDASGAILGQSGGVVDGVGGNETAGGVGAPVLGGGGESGGNAALSWAGGSYHDPMARVQPSAQVPQGGHRRLGRDSTGSEPFSLLEVDVWRPFEGSDASGGLHSTSASRAVDALLELFELPADHAAAHPNAVADILALLTAMATTILPAPSSAALSSSPYQGPVSAAVSSPREKLRSALLSPLAHRFVSIVMISRVLGECFVPMCVRLMLPFASPDEALASPRYHDRWRKLGAWVQRLVFRELEMAQPVAVPRAVSPDARETTLRVSEYLMSASAQVDLSSASALLSVGSLCQFLWGAVSTPVSAALSSGGSAAGTNLFAPFCEALRVVCTGEVAHQGAAWGVLACLVCDSVLLLHVQPVGTSVEICFGKSLRCIHCSRMP
jgi:hypothetical protein